MQRLTSSGHGTSKSEPVLYVVDDDPDIRRVVSQLADSIRVKSQSFQSGASFLDAIDPDARGCVLLDVRMPELSGLHVQRRLTELRATIPVIIMSGYGDIATVAQAMKAGCFDFIEKPFTLNRMIDCIHAAFRHDVVVRHNRAVRQQAISALAKLSEGETHVLECLLEGMGNKQIAEHLRLTPKAIEARRARIRAKLRVESLADIIACVYTARCEHGFACDCRGDRKCMDIAPTKTDRLAA